MSNFNIGGSGDLTDGTANISVATISISSLTPSTTMKSDLSSKIISSALDISDVSGLQSELDATIQNPFVGTLQATDFSSDNVDSYDTIVQALVASDSTKLSKTDTADQEFVSNLTLTDNTKKISATNIEMEELTTPNTFLNITGTISQTGNQYYIGNTATPANNFRINMLGTSTELRGAGGDVFLRSATDKVIVQGTELEAQCTVKIADIGPKLLLKENNNTLGQGGLIQFNDEADVPQSYIFMRTTGTISLLTDTDTILDASVAEVSIGGDLKINGLTQSTNPVTGSIQTNGGLGVVGNIYNGDGITTDGDLNVIGNYKSNGENGILAITSNGGTGSLTLSENNLSTMTGGSNTVLGNESGVSISDGSGNTIIGYQAGIGVNGQNNTCIGILSGQYTDGDNNTFIGPSAGRGIITGSFGSCNVTIGTRGLFAITTGVQNISLGCNSASTLTSGSYNVAIGDSSVLQPTLNNQIALGYEATTTSANQCVIGNSSITEISNAGNGVCDLGAPTRKFKDIYASGNITGDNGSAWGFYEHSGAPYPLVINSVATATLPNNALSSITDISQLPSNGYNFYDSSTNKFVPELVGDSYTLGIRITASSSSVTGSAELRLNIGAGTIILNLGVINFPKGSGVSTNFDRTTSVFTLATFVANGAVVELTSLVGDTTITSVGFHIVRTHRAR